jgi:RNA polymerase sigma-70 factor, ECF subfamily
MQASPGLSPSEKAEEIVRLLKAHEAGDATALDQLVPLVYRQLHGLARNHLRRRPGFSTLNTTGLVHEAYLKLAHSPELRLKDQGHLLAVSARAMGQVLVSRARARLRIKRGRGEGVLQLDEAQHGRASDAEQLLDLDRALAGLRENAEELASLFECRYFGGLSEEETALALGLSLRTVQRGWMRARAWLRAALEGATPSNDLTATGA